jgi:hypothetical protein
VAATALLPAAVPGGVAQGVSGARTVMTAEAAGASKASGTARAVKTVTLVTGDRVLLDGAGKVR